MGKREMYQIFRKAGFTRAAACGMLGNIGRESNFDSKNVENRSGIPDDVYTAMVNNGEYSRSAFVNDAYGYGLCQWTFWSRKAALYDFAYMGVESIGDERMQCEFIVYEMKKDFPDLYKYLCTTDNLIEATTLICDKYENPAKEVKALDIRIRIAQECANEPYDDPDPGEQCADDACPIDSIPPISDSIESCEIVVRVLRKGMRGRDVFIAQTMMNDMGRDCGVPDGDFGPHTETGVRDLQEICGLPVTGVIGQAEWQIIFQ